MTTMIVLLAGASLSLLFYALGLREDIDDLRKSKEELRESMSNTNYDLHQGIERLKREKHAQRKKLTAEIHALRTQLHQLRKDQQKQDNG